MRGADGVGNAIVDISKALNFVTCKVSLENIEPRDEFEAYVLRAVRSFKMQRSQPENKKFTCEEIEEIQWRRRSFDLSMFGLRDVLIKLLKDYGEVLDIDDVQYFFGFLYEGEKEHFFTYNLDAPKGFSEGDLLEIRRVFIQRYLDELPEGEVQTCKFKSLWFIYLIRQDIYCYERGENVLYIIENVIKEIGHPEESRQKKVDYVREVLTITLENLDNEKNVVAELEELKKKNSHLDYAISFERLEDGRVELPGFIVK